MYDLIIIGMGISGITAGIYATNANMKVLMFESNMPGGLLNNIDTIKNYPGLSMIKGTDFAMNLLKQVNDLQIFYKNEKVEKIEINEGFKTVYTDNDMYNTKNIILATGTKPKFLGLDNEKDLLGRGLSTCAICDGSFYKDKEVAVVGSGNSALQESLYLSKIASKVYLLIRKDTFTGDSDLVEKVELTSNIEVITKVKIEKYNEVEGKIHSVLLSNGNTINVAGVFIYIGYEPNNELVKEFGICNKDGRVEVDENFETKIKGLYAIGDIIDKKLYQLVTAASDGALVIKKINQE